MALHAGGVVAAERQRSGARLRQGVEDRALSRVVGRELQDLAATYPAHRDLIVEVDGPRIRRSDTRGLEAGFREDQQLRLHRDIERLQNRAQVSIRRLA